MPEIDTPGRRIDQLAPQVISVIARRAVSLGIMSLHEQTVKYAIAIVLVKYKLQHTQSTMGRGLALAFR